VSTAAEVYGKDIAFQGDFIPTATGDLDTVEGLENVKEALMRRLLTVPGTLVHRPDYGVGIKQYQNTLNSLDARRRLASRIMEEFKKDPRVESVTGVSFTIADDYSGRVEISVRIKLAGYDEQTLSFISFGEA